MTAPQPGPHRSLPLRWALITAGFIALALGAIGLFVPLLPTTPFILLAAACFARSSQRFHRWLLGNRIFGPMVREWEEHRSIPYRTKLVAIALMSVTMAASIVIFVRPLALQLAIAAFGVALAVWMYRIPSRDRRPRR